MCLLLIYYNHIGISIYSGDIKPLKGSGVKWLHFEVLSAIQV